MNKTVVTGVVGGDCHVMGHYILNRYLEREGFKIVDLGVMVSQQEYIDAAKESDAGAILISSSYGHAPLDVEGLREKCIEAGLKNILIYIGGNLKVGKRDWEITEKELKALGMDRVYPPDVNLADAVNDLKKDLASKSVADKTSRRQVR
jgi:methylaspartate mutase sigma subunit